MSHGPGERGGDHHAKSGSVRAAPVDERCVETADAQPHRPGQVQARREQRGQHRRDRCAQALREGGFDGRETQRLHEGPLETGSRERGSELAYETTGRHGGREPTPWAKQGACRLASAVRRPQSLNMATANTPSWWKEEHTSGWDRVKAALKRDWEQTRHDFSKKSAPDLHQNVGDTVKQAAGKEAIPPGIAPNPPDANSGSSTGWDHDESAVRYGYGAGHNYRAEHKTWDAGVESKLSQEWTDLKTGRTWQEAKDRVRQGWDASHKP